MPWPVGGAAGPPVFPIFLPFQGCPVRCVFCAQDVQTGLLPFSDPVAAVRAALTSASAALAERAARGLPPVEPAFYGGTFTALPKAALAACLRWAGKARERGWGHRVSLLHPAGQGGRDRVGPSARGGLPYGGAGGAEFCRPRAGSGAARLYGGDGANRLCSGAAGGAAAYCAALAGHARPQSCRLCRRCGVQPGGGRTGFAVLSLPGARGTGLAELWRSGRYRPWPLDATLTALAVGWLRAREAGVAVIRMGLAPEPGLDAAVLDGPRHAALGARVQGRALLLAVRRALEATCRAEAGFALEAPHACQGFFWGHKGELRPAWEDLGLRRLHFSARSGLLLEAL